MAIGVYFHPESMSPEQYDEVIFKLDDAGAASPEGRLYHVSFEVGGGLHVFDVWDTQENLDRFVNESLMPVLQEVGVDPGEPDISRVHNIIIG